MNNANNQTVSHAVSHIEDIYPGFSRFLVGADEDEIEALSTEVEHTLPPAYREFLQIMGRDPGPTFALMAGLDTRIQTLMAYYAEVGWRAPKRFTLIGRDRWLPRSTFLDSGGGPACSVLAFQIPIEAPMSQPWLEAVLLAETLGELVMRCALQLIARCRFTWVTACLVQAEPQTLAQIENALLHFGFQKDTQSIGLTTFYQLGDRATADVFQERGEDDVVLHISTDDRALADYIERELPKLLPNLQQNTYEAARYFVGVPAVRSILFP